MAGETNADGSQSVAAARIGLEIQSARALEVAPLKVGPVADSFRHYFRPPQLRVQPARRLVARPCSSFRVADQGAFSHPAFSAFGPVSNQGGGEKLGGRLVPRYRHVR